MVIQRTVSPRKPCCEKIARKRFVDEMGGDASQSLRKLVCDPVEVFGH